VRWFFIVRFTHYSSIPLFHYSKDTREGHVKRRGRLDDRGVVLVLALILLLVLTLIGISAISTTTFETGLSGNDRAGTEAFYASEAVIQIGLNQLPDVQAIAETRVGESSSGWTGWPEDKADPEEIKHLGGYPQAGYDVSAWGFTRYQVTGTGEASGSVKIIEVQVSHGPFPAGTQYNN
jgi:hypothetical protein